MIFCIDTYRTWIEVADDNLYKEHVIPRNNRTDFLVSRTLVLRACKPHGTYNRGMTWTIPEQIWTRHWLHIVSRTVHSRPG